MADTHNRAQSGRPVRSLLKRIAAMLAVLALLAWVGWRAWHDVGRIQWAELEVSPRLIALSVLCVVVAFFWQGLLWVVMIRGLGYTIGAAVGMRAAVVSLLGNYVPGKVVILIFRAEIAGRYGVPKVPVAGSVVLETLLRNLVAALLAGLGLYHMGVGQSYMAALAMMLLVSAVVAHPAVFNRLGNFVLRTLGRPELPRELGAGRIAALLAGYLVFWALYTSGFYLLTRGTLGAPLWDFPGLAISLMISQIGSTLTVFAPVGLGVSDATLAGVLALTGAVPGPGVLALVARVWRTLAEMSAIGLAWVLPAGVPGPKSLEEAEAPAERP